MLRPSHRRCQRPPEICFRTTNGLRPSPTSSVELRRRSRVPWLRGQGRGLVRRSGRMFFNVYADEARRTGDHDAAEGTTPHHSSRTPRSRQSSERRPTAWCASPALATRSDDVPIRVTPSWPTPTRDASHHRVRITAATPVPTDEVAFAMRRTRDAWTNGRRASAITASSNAQIDRLSARPGSAGVGCPHSCPRGVRKRAPSNAPKTVAECVLQVPGGDAPSAGSAAGDEGDDDVRGVAVEVLSTAVIDGGRAGIGVTSGDLHVA